MDTGVAYTRGGRGTYRLAIGTHRLAIGTYRLAIGTHRLAIGTYRLAIGTHRLAIGTYRLAIGTYRLAIGTYGRTRGQGGKPMRGCAAGHRLMEVQKQQQTRAGGRFVQARAKGQVWTHHFALGVPAFTRPSLHSQPHPVCEALDGVHTSTSLTSVAAKRQCLVFA